MTEQLSDTIMTSSILTLSNHRILNNLSSRQKDKSKLLEPVFTKDPKKSPLSIWLSFSLSVCPSVRHFSQESVNTPVQIKMVALDLFCNIWNNFIVLREFLLLILHMHNLPWREKIVQLLDFVSNCALVKPGSVESHSVRSYWKH